MLGSQTGSFATFFSSKPWIDSVSNRLNPEPSTCDPSSAARTVPIGVAVSPAAKMTAMAAVARVDITACLISNELTPIRNTLRGPSRPSARDELGRVGPRAQPRGPSRPSARDGSTSSPSRSAELAASRAESRDELGRVGARAQPRGDPRVPPHQPRSDTYLAKGLSDRGELLSE